jgi:hypothetical protein
MSMKNYHDLSSSSSSDLKAGFQFEFFCECCNDTWRSPFSPYRRGRLTGWLKRFDFVFVNLHRIGHASGAMADAGAARAKEAALAQASEQAARRFHACDSCDKHVCDNCFREHTGECRDCAAKGRAGGSAQARAHNGHAADQEFAGEPAAAGPACPNCQTPSEGGRFCHECGFDMASTHKSCPGCGTTVSRQARFCPDCGHGF